MDESCCFTLSFAADVRDGAFLIASVSFPEIAGHGCPPSSTMLGPLNMPHIVPVNRQPQSSFQHYVLVTCIPDGVTEACISFQNTATSGEGATAFVDNVVFRQAELVILVRRIFNVLMHLQVFVLLADHITKKRAFWLSFHIRNQ